MRLVYILKSRCGKTMKTFYEMIKLLEGESIQEMAWIIGDKSKETYIKWKEVIKTSSQFLRHITWQEVLKIMKKTPGLYEHYYDLLMKEEGWADEEWTAKSFLKDKSDVILASVDACEFMKTRSLVVTDPDPGWYIKQFTEKDYDPGLPLAMVVPKGVVLYDGNHRMQAACNLGQPGYVAIAYFMNYDAVKHTVLKVIE